MIQSITNSNIGHLTQAGNLPTFKVEWEDLLKRAETIVTISYSLSEIQEEVKKRTSYLGKFRSTEQAAHLLDLIAMTKDETDLFQSLVQTAATEVYACFAAFTGNKDSQFVYDVNMDTLSFVFVVPKSFNSVFSQPLDIVTKDALVFGVIYQWLLLAYPDEANTYVALYKNALEKVKENATMRGSNIAMIIPRIY